MLSRRAMQAIATFWVVVAVGVVGFLIVGHHASPADLVRPGLVVIGFLVISVLLSGLPIVIARRRRHHRIALVAALAVLGAVPVAGPFLWIAALVIATATRSQPPATDAPATDAPGTALVAAPAHSLTAPSPARGPLDLSGP